MNRPSLRLALGALLVLLSQNRWGLGAFAFVAMTPFLLVAAEARSRRAHLAWVVAVVAAFVLSTGKIVTHPLHPAAALLFGIPIGLMHVAAIGVATWIGRHRPSRAAWLAFPLASVVLETLYAALTPFATWGGAWATQVESLPLLQWGAWTGAVGISFLVNAGSAVLAELLRRRDRVALVHGGAYLAALMLAHAAGAARLALAPDAAATVRVAAVATDATFHGLPLPDAAEIAQTEATLADRTRRAARAGATLVVWPEGATPVVPERRPAFLAASAALARETRVFLVVASITPRTLAPLAYDNSYDVFDPDGRHVHRYAKMLPVPGEPAIPGRGIAPVVDGPFGRAAGAICYDYDFPRRTLADAERGLDLVFLPSSDWRGIDPIHTRMAVVRAIEGGSSLVRSTRFGLSIIVDPYGRVRAQHSAFEASDGVLVAEVPERGVRTLHARTGDLFVVLAAVVLLGLVVRPRRASIPARDEVVVG